jgi:hypothetical protein
VPVADRANSGDFYSRFRVTTDGLTTSEATGSKADGEVEDYRASIATLPVTLGSFESQDLGGSLDVRFTTLSETRNAGFELQGRTSDEEWKVLARIPARGADSLVPRTYRHRVPALLEGAAVAELRLVDLDYQGRRRPHGPFAPGLVYGSAPSARAIDWSSIKERTGARGPLEIVAGEGAAEPTTKPDSGSLADDLAARLLVTEKGLHRVTYEQLAAAGVDLAGQPSAALAVLNRDRAQPRHVGCGDTFGPGCFVEFLGKPKLTLHSPVDVYTLRVDAAEALPIVSSIGTSGVADAGFHKRKEQRYDNRLYSFGSPNGDPWFEERLLSYGAPAAAQRSFDLPDRGAGAVKLVVDLWGVTELPGEAPDHHVVIVLNGTEVRDLRFDGLSAQRLKIDVTPWVRETGNQLSIQVPGDTGYDFDLVHLEGFKAVYRGDAVAEGGRWKGRTFDSAPFAVTGLEAAPAVLWAATGQGWQRLEGMPAAGSDGLQLDSPWGGAKSWLAQEGSFLTPGIEAGLPLPAEPSLADYLIVTHPAFADELDDLVALQTRRGLTTDVVTTEQVYAAYSDHAADPEAIRQLVADSRALGGLSYVLLVGGDSYDPYDYLGLGSVSFVPSPYVAVGELVSFAPADDRLADVNGDSVPDVPLGRLPVRTPEELEALVDKLWAWELRNASREVLLASGRSDVGDELTSVTSAFEASLGSAWAADPAAVDHQGFGAVRGRVIGALNRGTALVSYVGHSSYGQWDFDPLLNLPDVASLGNAGKPSWVLQWGCWNSYFVSPEVATLSDALLLDHRGGAVGTIGATTLVASASHQALGRRFFAQLGNGAATFGEAFLGAKRDLAASGTGADAIAGTALLGDPATPVPNSSGPGGGRPGF